MWRLTWKHGWDLVPWGVLCSPEPLCYLSSCPQSAMLEGGERRALLGRRSFSSLPLYSSPAGWYVWLTGQIAVASQQSLKKQTCFPSTAILDSLSQRQCIIFYSIYVGNHNAQQASLPVAFLSRLTTLFLHWRDMPSCTLLLSHPILLPVPSYTGSLFLEVELDLMGTAGEKGRLTRELTDSGLSFHAKGDGHLFSDESGPCPGIKDKLCQNFLLVPYLTLSLNWFWEWDVLCVARCS